jgi:hypothetical protein
MILFINRLQRLIKLRELAISDSNIEKKIQADLLIRQVSERINYLTHFRYEETN